jgi:threonine synthase
MDILISSNLERLLCLLFGSDRCRELMAELSTSGKYRITDEELKRLQESFSAYYTDEAECADCIKRTFENENRLIDTHTAVALSAAERYMNDEKAISRMLVVSTASAYKFASDVLSSLGNEKPEDDLDAPALLNAVTGSEIPEPLVRALSKESVHLGIIDKSAQAEAVIDFALSTREA